MNPEATQQVIESNERLARAFTGALHKTPGEATLKRTRLAALSVLLTLLMVGMSVHARYPAPNEGVGGAMDKNGKPISHGVQAGEKIPHNFYLNVTNVRGHNNALVRTTCVATMLEGGHAANALPQRAKATVNCRMLPGHDAGVGAANVRATIMHVVNAGADDKINTTFGTATECAPPALTPELTKAVGPSPAKCGRAHP